MRKKSRAGMALGLSYDLDETTKCCEVVHFGSQNATISAADMTEGFCGTIKKYVITHPPGTVPSPDGEGDCPVEINNYNATKVTIVGSLIQCNQEPG